MYNDFCWLQIRNNIGVTEDNTFSPPPPDCIPPTTTITPWQFEVCNSFFIFLSIIWSYGVKCSPISLCQLMHSVFFWGGGEQKLYMEFCNSKFRNVCWLFRNIFISKILKGIPLKVIRMTLYSTHICMSDNFRTGNVWGLSQTRQAVLLIKLKSQRNETSATDTNNLQYVISKIILLQTNL